MIVLILHKLMMAKIEIGFSISEINKNFLKWLLSSRFDTVFNGGDPKIVKIKKILHMWGEPIDLRALNSVYILSNKTIFEKNRDIIAKLFELSIKYKNLY